MSQAHSTMNDDDQNTRRRPSRRGGEAAEDCPARGQHNRHGRPGDHSAWWQTTPSTSEAPLTLTQPIRPRASSSCATPSGFRSSRSVTRLGSWSVRKRRRPRWCAMSRACSWPLRVSRCPSSHAVIDPAETRAWILCGLRCTCCALALRGAGSARRNNPALPGPTGLLLAAPCT